MYGCANRSTIIIEKILKDSCGEKTLTKYPVILCYG